MTDQQQTTLFLELTIDNQLIRVPISPSTKITLSFSTGTGSPQVDSLPVPVIPPKPSSLFENSNSQEKPTIPDQGVKQELGLQEDLSAAIKSSPILPKAYSRFQSQCDQLFQAGFTEIQKNISVLRQCNGDFNAAIQILKRTSQELSNQSEETNPSSSENSIEEPKISPIDENSSNNLFDSGSQKLSQESDLSKQADSPKSEEAEVPSPDYSHEVEALVQKGFCNRKQNLKLLQKFAGNIAQVESFLSSKRKQLPEKFAPLLEQYAEQLAVLNHKGFCNQRKNLNLLQRHNGDLGLTLQKLQKPSRGGNKSSNH